MPSGSGCFVIKLGVKAMKAINLQADAFTRATQIAVGELKSEFRASGRKLSEWLTHEHRSAISEYLAQHPEVIERAAIEVAAWRKKGRLKRVRRTPDFWAVLH